jgi:catechol 2,3-dioxygenase-like lactoylglutathione lyase family enzyme
VFDHITLRVSDREASERFYDTVLRTLGIERTHADAEYTLWHDFSLAAANGDKPVTRRLHVGFVAPSRDHVDTFWQAGTDAGHRDDGEPGPRPQYGPDYYGGFLLDPDGNSAEAVHHGSLRAGGVIDHLWIRVADVAASKRFYGTVAPHAGFGLLRETPERAQFTGGNGSFSVVAGEPSENVHLAFPASGDAAVDAFPASEDATVDAFHRAALEAGYRDNGAPGKRHYHRGYYSAFALDPDGNNVEVVNHRSVE